MDIPIINKALKKARSVKLIKKHERVSRRRRAPLEQTVNPNRWSKSVRSWVVEFQERDRDESLPAFDGLFKDAPPQLEPTD
jgi:hypothetical protein